MKKYPPSPKKATAQTVASNNIIAYGIFRSTRECPFVASTSLVISEPQISFFSNRLEILSHGSLPNNLSIDEFFAGISKPRNLALMKIFSDLDIVDHTGHGIPTIVEHYGKEVFNIQSTYILVSIPFDKEVLNKTNVGINDTEKVILDELLKNPTLTADRLSLIIKKSKRTVERYLKALQEKGYLERNGSNKTGIWKIIK